MAVRRLNLSIGCLRVVVIWEYFDLFSKHSTRSLKKRPSAAPVYSTCGTKRKRPYMALKFDAVDNHT